MEWRPEIIVYKISQEVTDLKSSSVSDHVPEDGYCFNWMVYSYTYIKISSKSSPEFSENSVLKIFILILINNFILQNVENPVEIVFSSITLANIDSNIF